MRQILLIVLTAICLTGAQAAGAQSVANDTAPSVYNRDTPPALQDANDIVLYPNPAEDEVNVIFNPAAGIKNVAIYNLIGKVMYVYHVSGGSARLDINTLPSGIYFMRFVGDQGNIIATRKFTRR